ncbi:UTP--glucose-1-phosphate uridylyltransferase [Candidatus Roizmanbacteria bacterium]|nr:UTP--glucose-1-phosphate uridylyltransferase [Candidatus Roizmanbacteria bacterium]
MAITKVVIPAAGFGTRFLPQTKAMPKEMLPIVDKPVIQYVVEEAVQAGIADVILVTGSNKRAIEDHFDAPDEDLLKNLNQGGKTELIEEIKKISEMANFIYVRQKGPYGNATPIRSAQHVVENEPFLVLWGDEFVIAEPSRAKQLISSHEKYQAPILGGVIKEEADDFTRYGYVKGTKVEPNVWKVEGLVEKPGQDNAPSNLAIVGGYLLTQDIFPVLEAQQPGKGGEYYLLEAINVLAQKTPVYAIEIQNGKYYDTGNKLEYMKTATELALKHPDINGPFVEFLKSLNL